MVNKILRTLAADILKKKLNNWTLPVVVPTINQRVDDRIVPIGGASQTLSTYATKEVVVDTTCSGVWVNRAT